MAKKFTLLNFLRKKRKQPASLPPSTTRPNRYRPKDVTAVAAEKKDDPGKTKNNGMFAKNKGPGGLEVTTGATSTAGAHDEVSEITPVTGLPPDSPSPLRNLPSLLPPPQPSGSTGSALSAGSPSPPRTPSRGDMRIHVPAWEGSNRSEDDISAMTPGGASPGRLAGDAPRQELKLQRILGDGDDYSREPTVFEDDEGDRSSGGGRAWFGPSQRPKPPTKEAADSIKRECAELVKSTRSWFTSTKYFKKAVDSAFNMIDADKSGDVTLEELHAGLLLIHLKIATFAGAPACRPASKEYVTEIFHLFDWDNSKTLSREEFGRVMRILYSQVFTRIIMQWGLTLMIVPFVSVYVIKYTSLLYWTLMEFWKDIDDELDPLQRLLWKIWALFLWYTPGWMDRMGESAWSVLCKVPVGVWKRLPHTILTLAQTSFALPYTLSCVEDFFRKAALKDMRKHEC